VKICNMAIGAGTYGCLRGLYSLAYEYAAGSGYGLHPVVCLWAGAILLVAVTAYGLAKD